jgi:hypothetical protein
MPVSQIGTLRESQLPHLCYPTPSGLPFPAHYSPSDARSPAWRYRDIPGGICGPQTASKRYFPFRDNNLRAHASPCPELSPSEDLRRCRFKARLAPSAGRPLRRPASSLTRRHPAYGTARIFKAPYLQETYERRNVREGSSASFKLP